MSSRGRRRSPRTRNNMGAPFLLALSLAAAAAAAAAAASTDASDRAFAFCDGGPSRFGDNAVAVSLPAPQRVRALPLRLSTTTTTQRSHSPSSWEAADGGPEEGGEDDLSAGQIITGLTEDGDFALFGINAVDPTSTARGGDDDGEVVAFDHGGARYVDPAASPPGLSFLLGMDRDDRMTGRSSLAAVPDVVSPSAAFAAVNEQFRLRREPERRRPDEEEEKARGPTPPSQGEGSHEAPSNPSSSDRVDPEDEAWLKDWLVDAIPTLKPNDAREYARGLARIGFDPECVTRSELKLDDLSFMKVLHRRYLYNKVLEL